MSLPKTVKEILARHEKEGVDRKDAIRRVEEIADRFKDVKPRTDVTSPERYMGLPAFSD